MSDKTKTLRLIIDIDVIMEDENDSPDWVVPAIQDDPKKEIILGGYWFKVTHVEEAPSSADETENARRAQMQRIETGGHYTG
jgi:hypothetical protein